MQNFDSKQKTDLVILDFSKAFDIVPHKKLLFKLSKYGITGNINKWIQSFLVLRKQQVIVEGESSKPCSVDSGVPQGSVLGPLLFLCHINDLPQRVTSKVRLFADDCLLYRPIHSPRDQLLLQQDLAALETWAEDWGMRFNVLCMYLGFTLDCHLTMNAHVSNIARTCYVELRRLAYIRRFQTSTATATLVSAFVLSRIDYCNSLLFGSTLDVTSHLQRIQNYAARVILRLPMSSRITIHLKSLHWLPVKVRSTYKIACLCYHCHSSTAPSYVTDMLHKKPLHTRNTRSSSYTMPLLNRPAHSKATLGDRSFSFASSSVWNSIPNDVKCAPSLSSFKSRLKTYLFRSVYKD